MWFLSNILKNFRGQTNPMSKFNEFYTINIRGLTYEEKAMKTLMFIYWKAFSDISEDLCPKSVIVHGLCLLQMLHWWREHLKQPYPSLNILRMFIFKLGVYLWTRVKDYFILCKVHLKIQPEVQTSLLIPKAGVSKSAITKHLNKQLVAVLIILKTGERGDLEQHRNLN